MDKLDSRLPLKIAPVQYIIFRKFDARFGRNTKASHSFSNKVMKVLLNMDKPLQVLELCQVSVTQCQGEALQCRSTLSDEGRCTSEVQ